MRTQVNVTVPATKRYVSWADRVFNPWLSQTRSVGCSHGNAAGLIHDADVGDGRAAVSWNAGAEAFATYPPQLLEIESELLADYPTASIHRRLF